VRNLLAYLNGGGDEKSISPIVNEVLIVPETKRVFDLMKEMQAKAEQLAVVVNEYGTVSGLVTIEDLIEEIVGDIRDEDEFHRIDLVYEGDGNYIVRGGVEIGELEETLDVRFGEHEAATVSGLVVDHLGAVPVQGDTVEIEQVQIQVLSADRKRIHTMRVRRLGSPEHNSAEPVAE
jgi:magnesium and cobalt transporter